MLWFIFITFWYDKVSIKINKSISYEQAPLLLFKMSSVTLVNFTATSQSASHSYHIIKCSLCLVLLQYAPYIKFILIFLLIKCNCQYQCQYITNYHKCQNLYIFDESCFIHNLDF